MKRISFVLLLLFTTFFSFAQDFPERPNTLVNDYAGVLSATEKAALEQKLVTFDDSSSTQIAIAILKSVGDYDINEYAVELGRRWGVGQGKTNNGIMIVVAVGDRKISIQTGYGLEGALPDVYVKRIIEYNIKPQFKGGHYYAGLDEGTTSIIKYTKGEYKNDKPKGKDKDDISIFSILVIIVIIILVIKLMGGGGGKGGGSQVIGGRGASDALFWAMLLGNRGGGGSWGGGSGGGGFGGFGGGSFGGGGSSGSW